VTNLVSNALKFTPTGGRVRVAASAEAIVDDSGRTRIWVRIDVVDSGPGIPTAQRTALFQKFAQVDERRGMGLGLYISREIVRQHGGEIWFESELGRGSTFSFRVPAAQPAEPEVLRRRAGAASLGGRR
jgi:signal transduction histidine kinase